MGVIILNGNGGNCLPLDSLILLDLLTDRGSSGFSLLKEL